jgi:hypothetical protein
VPEEIKNEEYVEATLFDLVSAFKDVLSQAGKRDNFRQITREVVTVEQKIEEIIKMFTAEKNTIKFSNIFDSAVTRLEIVVSFLALLELVRLHEIWLYQKKVFDEMLSKLKRKKVYLSLDIDGIDPAYAPGTGTPEPNSSLLKWLSPCATAGPSRFPSSTSHCLARSGSFAAILNACIGSTLVSFMAVKSNVAGYLRSSM